VRYAGKERTPDEEPLRSRCLPILRERFPRLEWQGYQLLGMVRRLYGDNAATRALDAFDRVSLRCFRPLRHWCRYAVLTLPR
jgi:hypothetical protein